ncbi:MAG: heme NO-binding domain-containing protein [Mucilaginibacter sp.]
MCVITNNTIHKSIKALYSQDKYNAIHKLSQITNDLFTSTSCEESVTYKLACELSADAKIPVEDTLRAMGECWLLTVGREKHLGLLKCGKLNFQDLLMNIPLFYERIMQLDKKQSDVDLSIRTNGSTSVDFEYMSGKPGLAEFMRGALHGLGRIFSIPVIVQLIENKNDTNIKSTFRVSW